MFSCCCRRLEDSFDHIDFVMKCLAEMPHAPLDRHPRKRQQMGVVSLCQPPPSSPSRHQLRRRQGGLSLRRSLRDRPWMRRLGSRRRPLEGPHHLARPPPSPISPVSPQLLRQRTEETAAAAVPVLMNRSVAATSSPAARRIPAESPPSAAKVLAYPSPLDLGCENQSGLTSMMLALQRFYYNCSLLFYHILVFIGGTSGFC
jgi:hypothetical protein